MPTDAELDVMTRKLGYGSDGWNTLNGVDSHVVMKLAIAAKQADALECLASVVSDDGWLRTGAML